MSKRHSWLISLSNLYKWWHNLVSNVITINIIGWNLTLTLYRIKHYWLKKNLNSVSNVMWLLTEIWPELGIESNIVYPIHFERSQPRSNRNVFVPELLQFVRILRDVRNLKAVLNKNCKNYIFVQIINFLVYIWNNVFSKKPKIQMIGLLTYYWLRWL